MWSSRAPEMVRVMAARNSSISASAASARSRAAAAAATATAHSRSEVLMALALSASAVASFASSCIQQKRYLIEKVTVA